MEFKTENVYVARHAITYDLVKNLTSSCTVDPYTGKNLELKDRYKVILQFYNEIYLSLGKSDK